MSDSATTSLVGTDFSAVCERYGAPLGCTFDGGVLRLAYRMRTGVVQDGAIEMIDGVVVSEAPWIRRSATPCCGQELVGMPVEQALPPLGKPQRTEELGESTRFTFDELVVTAHEGTVACVTARSRASA